MYWSMSFEPGPLLASLLVSSAGFVLFVYGRRQARLPHGLAGLILLVYPYFVPSPLFVLLIAAAICGVLWLAVKFGW
jgi:hypothetical protein